MEYPLVRVTWIDHWASETNNPMTLEEIQQVCHPRVRVTTGHLIEESRDCIALYHTAEDDNTWCDIDFIFKRGIKKREVIG